MEQILNNGKCPECELKGIKSIVQLNLSDMWECPKCRLQLVTVSEEHVGIENKRGKGQLKDDYYKAEKFIKGKILLRRPLYEGDDCIIKNEEELKEYLNQII